MEPDRPKPRAATSALAQRLARFALATAVVALGVWILFDFLPALVWAAVFAIALWPLYRHLLRLLPLRGARVLGPLLATTLIGVVIIAPLVLLGVAVGRESHVVIEFVSTTRHQGLQVPDWIGQLYVIGPPIAEWWHNHLSDPAMADELIGRNLHALAESARQYGGEIIHRVTLLLFTLLTLFFLFRDGAMLTERLRGLSDRVLGAHGERVTEHVIAAVHGTVNGLVLVGLAEGILLGLVYLIVGLPYPASVGALTGVAAVIPFAAPAVYCLAALYLFAVGKAFAGIVVIVAGSVVVFIADHFVRPFLIGGAAHLPFLMVLLGILGGLKALGFLGVFIGPAAMAALVALWRDWTEPPADPHAPVFALRHAPDARSGGRPRS